MFPSYDKCSWYTKITQVQHDCFWVFLWRVYLVFVPVFKVTTSGSMEISWTGKGKTVKFFVVVELPLCRVTLWDGEIYFPLWLDCKCPTCVCALGPQTVALLGEAVHLLGGKTSLEKGCHRGLVLGFKTCPHFSAPSHHAFSSMVDTQTMSLNISLSCFLWIV